MAGRRRDRGHLLRPFDADGDGTAVLPRRDVDRTTPPNFVWHHDLDILSGGNAQHRGADRLVRAGLPKRSNPRHHDRPARHPSWFWLHATRQGTRTTNNGPARTNGAIPRPRSGKRTASIATDNATACATSDTASAAPSVQTTAVAASSVDTAARPTARVLPRAAAGRSHDWRVALEEHEWAVGRRPVHRRALLCWPQRAPGWPLHGGRS